VSGRLDPDELAHLEEERDHLLASLEDLEAEHAAGDLDDGDYRELKDDYTVRAAEVLAAIEERRALIRRAAQERRSPARTLFTAAAVVVFAVVAGVLVARSAGQRGDGPITGAVNTFRSRLATCQQASFRDPEAGIECYDEILADAPDNVEALTYQGWALIRADRVTEGARNLTRAVELDPDAPDPRVFRAILAARAGDHELAAAEIDRFYRNDPSPAAVGVLRSQALEREVFVELLEAPVRRCWVDAARAQPSEGAEGGAFLADLGDCLDRVLAAAPGSVDALVSRAYASVGPGSTDLSDATELAERAVASDPASPNARLPRASLALAQGRTQVAEADLAELGRLPRPTASFLFGGPEELRAALDAARTSSTTTAEVPSAVPNPEGG
jgi:tetratricopeptide (TPR) repeat protein